MKFLSKTLLSTSSFLYPLTKISIILEECNPLTKLSNFFNVSVLNVSV